MDDVEGEEEEEEEYEDAEEENEGIMAWEWNNGGRKNERVKGVEGRKWRSGGDGVVMFLRG